MRQDEATQTSWVDVLRSVGWPTEVVVLDFECYWDSEYNLSKMSTIEYIQSPKFEELGLARLLMRGNLPYADPSQNCRWEADIVGFLAWLQHEYGSNLEGCTVVAQNARFDASILAFRHGIMPPHILDIMALSLHINPQCPADLASNCKRYGLPSKGNTKDFMECTHRSRFKKTGGRKKAIKGMPVKLLRMTHEKEMKLAVYAVNDALREWDLLPILLPKLSNPQTEIPLIQHTLQLFLRPTIVLDMELGEELEKGMLNEVHTAAADAGYDFASLSGNHSFRDLLAEALSETGEEVPLKPNKKGEMIPALAKTDEAQKYLLNHKTEKVRKLMAGRVAIKSWPSKAKRVRKMMNQAGAVGGVLPVPLKYYGAHTGRWSGDEDINLQNLGARGHELDSRVRNMLRPPKGYVFISCDQAAVEARGTAWIAGQEDLLDAFRRDEDVYCRFASKVLGTTVRKPRADDPIPVQKRFKKGRAYGKVGILGGGYGMGAEKCQSYGVGYGLKLDFPEAKRIIDTYRASNPKIVRFWKDVERAFRYTLKYGKESRMKYLTFHLEENGWGAPGSEADMMVITLPSGRELRYEDVRVEPDPKFGTQLVCFNHRTHETSKIYGGHLTENIIQAICRDTLGLAILEIEAAGYRVVLHVHDEVLVICLKNDMERCKRIVVEAMRRTPSWAPGLPLNAEAVVLERYEK